MTNVFVFGQFVILTFSSFDITGMKTDILFTTHHVPFINYRGKHKRRLCYFLNLRCKGQRVVHNFTTVM